MSQRELFPVIFTMNYFRPFSKSRSDRGKGSIHGLIILNGKKKKGRGTMGTVIETEESVEHFRATSDFTVCLSPRQRVTE